MSSVVNPEGGSRHCRTIRWWRWDGPDRTGRGRVGRDSRLRLSHERWWRSPSGVSLTTAGRIDW